VKHRYRFRFVNPLLQPFVVMQGINDGLIDGSVPRDALGFSTTGHHVASEIAALPVRQDEAAETRDGCP
jgi:hypothetical protein